MSNLTKKLEIVNGNSQKRGVGGMTFWEKFPKNVVFLASPLTAVVHGWVAHWPGDLLRKILYVIGFWRD